MSKENNIKTILENLDHTDIREKQNVIDKMINTLLAPMAKDFSQKYKDSDFTGIASSVTVCGVKITVGLSFNEKEDE